MSHCKRMRKRKPMELNLTAFIDIVFLLLVFFIATSGFIAGEGVLSAPRPRGPGDITPVPVPTVPLRIDVSSSGETGYRLDVAGYPTRPANFGHLYKMLADLQHNPAEGRTGVYAPKDPLVVSPSKDVRWQHAVNAYNAARRAGYLNVQFEPVRE